MKSNVLFLLVFSMFAYTSVQAQRGVRIGYIDMEYILQNVDEYQEANSQLGTKVQKWKGEIEQKKSSIEQMKKDLSVEKVLLTKELIQEREEEISVLESELLEYQQDRFGPQGDLVIQRNLLAKPVQDQVFAAVQEIAKNRRYDMIFDRSDAVMLFALEKHDISDLVLRSLNREEKKRDRLEKANKGRKRFSESSDDTTDEDIAEPEIDPEVEARKQAAEEKRAQRIKDLEDLKQKKQEEREAKKKAYEERRQKLLEERAARKKAKEEERKKNKEDQENTEEENNDDN